jgi:hypothetical protein
MTLRQLPLVASSLSGMLPAHAQLCPCARCDVICHTAAGTIHTDFERGFICAEVMKFDELKELGTENAVKAAGKYKQVSKLLLL